jgi:D-alanyl-D-alanine carboxypeptidase
MDKPLSFSQSLNMKKSVAISRPASFIAAFVLSVLAFWGLSEVQKNLEDYMYADISRPLQNMSAVSFSAPDGRGADLCAKAAMVRKIGAAGKGRIVYKLNEDEILPIASITKLMTAVIVSENPDRFDQNLAVTVSPAAASQEDVPVFGNLEAGHSYTVGNLMELMLQYSSNDAAYALSEVIGPGAFVGKMNEKAKSLGLASTTYYNPTGLDLDDGRANASTAKDLTDLAAFILKEHPGIFSITAGFAGYLTSNGIHSLELWDGETLAGGKTGYTEKAGGCMIVLFKDLKGSTFVNVLLGASSSETRVAETQKLINLVGISR